MRILKWKRVVCLMVVGLCSAGSVPAFADDDGKDNPPAKPAATNLEAPAPLTARERMLLDRVEQLEKRVADLEGKTNATTVSGADAAANQPASTTPVASTTGVAAPVATSGATPASPDLFWKGSTTAVEPQTADKGKLTTAKAPASEPFACADCTWLNGNHRIQRA